jgi:VanZ family protein
VDVDAETQLRSARLAGFAAPSDGAALGLRRLRNALALYWLAMFVGSHLKLHDAVQVFHIRDKVLHFLAYAGLAFLAASYQRFRKGSISLLDVALVWTVAVSYGVLDEITQIPVGRTADPLDWLADAAGAAAGLVAFLAMRRYVMPDRCAAQTSLGG